MWKWNKCIETFSSMSWRWFVRHTTTIHICQSIGTTNQINNKEYTRIRIVVVVVFVVTFKVFFSSIFMLRSQMPRAQFHRETAAKVRFFHVSFHVSAGFVAFTVSWLSDVLIFLSKRRASKPQMKRKLKILLPNYFRILLSKIHMTHVHRTSYSRAARLSIDSGSHTIVTVPDVFPKH